jgi:purine-binding chemotaxis protein CheW
MGRMADARKRARRKGERGGEPPPTPATEAPREPVFTSIPMSVPPSPLVVTNAPEEPRRAGRIELPSSGLAADILAREEARQVEVMAPLLAPAASVPMVPAAKEAAAQSLSFFSAPVQEERAAAEAVEHLATFNLDREEYGVEVRLVQEIRRVSEITVVPRAPAFVRGVINLRGRILPVVDLKKKLGLGEVEIQKASRIVVVRLKERLLGLLVDGASQVLKVPMSRIEPPPDEIVNKGGDTIRGVAKLEGRLVILLDLNRVLAQELKE